MLKLKRWLKTISVSLLIALSGQMMHVVVVQAKSKKAIAKSIIKDTAGFPVYLLKSFMNARHDQTEFRLGRSGGLQIVHQQNPSLSEGYEATEGLMEPMEYYIVWNVLGSKLPSKTRAPIEHIMNFTAGQNAVNHYVITMINGLKKRAGVNIFTMPIFLDRVNLKATLTKEGNLAQKGPAAYYNDIPSEIRKNVFSKIPMQLYKDDFNVANQYFSSPMITVKEVSEKPGRVSSLLLKAVSESRTKAKFSERTSALKEKLLPIIKAGGRQFNAWDTKALFHWMKLHIGEFATRTHKDDRKNLQQPLLDFLSEYQAALKQGGLSVLVGSASQMIDRVKSGKIDQKWATEFFPEENLKDKQMVKPAVFMDFRWKVFNRQTDPGFLSLAWYGRLGAKETMRMIDAIFAQHDRDVAAAAQSFKEGGASEESSEEDPGEDEDLEEGEESDEYEYKAGEDDVTDASEGPELWNGVEEARKALREARRGLRKGDTNKDDVKEAEDALKDANDEFHSAVGRFPYVTLEEEMDAAMAGRKVKARTAHARMMARFALLKIQSPFFTKMLDKKMPVLAAMGLKKKDENFSEMYMRVKTEIGERATLLKSKMKAIENGEIKAKLDTRVSKMFLKEAAVAADDLFGDMGDMFGEEAGPGEDLFGEAGEEDLFAAEPGEEEDLFAVGDEEEKEEDMFAADEEGEEPSEESRDEGVFAADEQTEGAEGPAEEEEETEEFDFEADDDFETDDEEVEEEAEDDWESDWD